MTDMNTIEIADTVRWLERAVIGLNLCPFAKAPHVKGQIHYVLSEAKGLEGLRDELIEQLQALAATSAEERETVLLIVPQMLRDFLEFNGDRSAHPWTYDYLWSWVFSISGGTSEIQRENIADRVLGLPRAR